MSMARAIEPTNRLINPVQPRAVNSILLFTFLLLFIGLLMMTSASVELASSQYSDPFFFLKRQLIFSVSRQAQGKRSGPQEVLALFPPLPCSPQIIRTGLL